MIISYHDSYDSQAIYNTIRNFIESDDALSKKFTAGANLLIKPNLCLPYSPEKGITTHPLLTEQMIRVALDMGLKVSIGESAIAFSMENAFDHLLKITGFYELGKKYDIPIYDFNRFGAITKTFEVNGKKILAPISKLYLEADIVVNMPKFKTHILTGFSGAIKNIYGCVRGKFKGLIHGSAENQMNFCKIVTEIYRQRKIDLTIMDAIEGLDGDGPGVLGNVQKLGFLLIGTDGYMIDKYCAKMMGIDPNKISTNYFYEQMERVSKEDEPINGELPKLTLQLPYTFSKMKELDPNFRIVINTEICSKCGKCAAQCPQKCILLENDKMEVKLETCIHCLCCHEVCPQGAVDITM
jgi:uncharacterized protein (DUF362 family)/Pyruvate/2-oxoacid:ferredoxin oxidoreductase delta subunit